MDQFQHARARARLAQLLDHPKADAAAAMHRHPGGLVDGQYAVVFQQHRKLFGRRRGQGFGLGAFGDAQGRHPDQVARLDPGVGAGATLVDPHLAGANDAVNMGFGHPFEVAQQEVVQALAGRFLVDRQVFHFRRTGGVCCPYNVLHQRWVPSA